MPDMRGILIVDKASGPTSHDVVRVARRVFGTRAVGHAGTLDPMATGVLVLGIGEGTKLLAHLSADDKAYDAQIRLGVLTDTLDARGKPIAEQPVPAGLDVAYVQTAAARFAGETLQRAPDISAIKQAGQPLYARVRRGEQVEAPERRVFVRELAIDGVEGDSIALRVHCAKGFYVRALARDLAQALGTVGHLTMLRRTRSGSFDLAGALAFDTLEAAARGDESARAQAHAALRSLEAAVAGLTAVVVTSEGSEDVRHGRVVVPARLSSGEIPALGTEPVAVFDPGGRLAALGRVAEDGLRVVRGFPEDA